MSIKRFTTAFNKAVEHNQANDKKKSFTVTYKKMNGRTVKRKIDPYVVRGNLVLAYDHKRKATRSFKLDKVKSMEKAAFMSGFSKSAKIKGKHIAAGVAALGGAGLIGGAIGHKKGKKKGITEGLNVGTRFGASLQRLKDKHPDKKFGVQAHYDTKNKRLITKLHMQGADKEKTANAVMELAGLGTLAIPSIQHMRGKHISQDNVHRAEVAGLGILAAPYAGQLAMKSKTVSNLVKTFKSGYSSYFKPVKRILKSII